MKTVGIVVIAAIVSAFAAAPAEATGSHSKKGYVKKNGTYVAPSHATNPNKTKRDNYSSKGNTNPRTGKQGTKEADK